MLKQALIVIDVESRFGWKILAGSRHRGRTAQKLRHVLQRVRSFFLQDREYVAQKLQHVLQKIRSSGGLVIFVMYPRGNYSDQIHYHGYCSGCDGTSSRLAPFLKHRHNDSGEPLFFKQEMDAFSNADLNDFLHNQGVQKLLLAGSETSRCVKETAKSALAHGFAVTLLNDCAYPPLRTQSAKTEWRNGIANGSPTSPNLSIVPSHELVLA